MDEGEIICDFCSKPINTEYHLCDENLELDEVFDGI